MDRNPQVSPSEMIPMLHRGLMHFRWCSLGKVFLCSKSEPTFSYLKLQDAVAGINSMCCCSSQHAYRWYRLVWLSDTHVKGLGFKPASAVGWRIGENRQKEGNFFLVYGTWVLYFGGFSPKLADGHRMVTPQSKKTGNVLWNLNPSLISEVTVTKPISNQWYD